MALHLVGEWVKKYKGQTEVTVEDKITVVPPYAFGYGEEIKYISLPDSVMRIDIGAFKRCEALEKIILPKSIDSICNRAFEDCLNLKNIEIPHGLTEISNGTFFGCKSLEYIRIPEGVRRIGMNAFCDCKSLRKISFPDSLEEIDDNAFSNCVNLESIEGGNVRKIGENAFFNCISLSKFKLGSCVDSISDSAFYNSLFKVPNYILVGLNDKYVFDSVVRIPNGILSVTEDSLVRNENEPWNEVILPDSVKNISFNAFYNFYMFVFEKGSRAEHRIKCLPKRMNMPLNYFRQKTAFDARMALMLADTLWKDFVTDEDFEYMLLYQNSRTAQYGACDFLSENCSCHLNNMMKRTDNSPLQLEHLASYAATYLKRIDLSLLETLKKRAERRKAYKALEILDKYCFAFLNDSQDEITDFCLKYFSPYKAERYFCENNNLNPLLNRVRYRKSDKYVPDYILKCVLAAYMEQLPENFDELDECVKFNIVNEADIIASEFDSESFMSVIDELPDDDLKLLLPICRYGSADMAVKICDEISKMNINDCNFMLDVAKKALELSENDEARTFLEGVRYAENSD